MTDFVVTPVLLIGFDPAVGAGHDVLAVASAFDLARARAVEAGIGLVECLVRPDESAEAQIRSCLQSRSWDCVVIGGGIRKPEAALEFFENVVNLVRVDAPTAVIAFNTSPADTIEAAARALQLRGRVREIKEGKGCRTEH